MSVQAIAILFYLSFCGTIATALVAYARNRSWVNWLLLAAIINPIVAWPLLMCVPVGSDEKSAKTTAPRPIGPYAGVGLVAVIIGMCVLVLIATG